MPKSNTKTFAYCRVSSTDQNEDRQVEAMLELGINERDIFIDKCSGKNFDRPQYQALKLQLREGDVLVIKSIDRLSRNYKESKQLWEEIVGKGADIVVIDMPILDTRQYKDLLGNFISDLILSVLSYVAEQENDFRRQRQAEGIAAMPIVDGKKVSKKTKRPTGRPTIDFPSNWEEQYNIWKLGEQTAKVTMDNLGLKKNTFYKLVKEHEQNISTKKDL